MTQKLIFLLFT